MLEARGVTLTLGGRRVLEAVDLAVAPGEVVVLAGPNGAGKSSLLACLSGALAPEGAALLDGAPVATLGPVRLARLRAVLEQTPVLGAPFTVRELAGLTVPREVAPAEARRVVTEALSALGLLALADRPADRISGGELHRAQMARALAQLSAGRLLGGGRYLLVDEPTASLDLRHQAAAMRAARRAAEAGAGVLAVLHDLALAAAFADRIALMEGGRIVAGGSPREVLTAPLLSRLYRHPVAVSEAAGRLAIAPIFDSQPSHQEEPECSSP